MASTETALAVIETVQIADLFKPEVINPILERIRSEALAIPQDISTAQGRKNCASLAYDVARSKTFVNKCRLELVEDEKKRLKAIDVEAKRIMEILQALQDEVRKPLDDYENAEKDRVAKHEINISNLVQDGSFISTNWETVPLADMKGKLAAILASDYDWEEFLNRAKAAVMTTIAQIKDAIQRREKLESERAELEALRVAKAERDQADLLARTAREATEAAERAASEREATAAREASEREATAVHEKEAAEERVRQAELAAVEAAAQAERDKTAAVEAERQRAAAAEKAEEAAAKLREKDEEHKAEIDNAAVDAIVELKLMPKDVAKSLITTIAKGKIPNVKISY